MSLNKGPRAAELKEMKKRQLGPGIANETLKMHPMCLKMHMGLDGKSMKS